jgi:5-methylcytosine-specific restriction enzyme B
METRVGCPPGDRFDKLSDAMESTSRSVALRRFEQYFDEFAGTYLRSKDGLAHLAAYPSLRAQARSNYESLCREADAQHLEPSQVLLRLLPWTDTAANRGKGAWIHVAPAITGDVVRWFEGAHWTRREDWPLIEAAILAFVRGCVETPPELDRRCAEFSELPYSKGFQTGMLTPALNALRPDSFLIINQKSLTTINHFAGTDFATTLADYPPANRTGFAFIHEAEPAIARAAASDALAVDLFDCFSHWLVAIKRFDFGHVGYYKIAPGENARLWQTWQGEGIASIGWHELGNLTDLAYAEYADRRDRLLGEHPDWTKEGMEQAWTFAHLREGDRIVANRGTTEVLGIGRVTGTYYFVAGEEYGHRIRVDWDDTRPRAVSQGGWRRTLIKLKRADYDDIVEGPAIAAPGMGPQTFELLERLHADPTAAYYLAHKPEFEALVERPLQDLLRKAALDLPPQAQELLETERNLFSRIPKNDYGRGGAWDFYWGALYPKHGKRIADAQLFVVLNRLMLEFGFSVGDYGREARFRLQT